MYMYKMDCLLPLRDDRRVFTIPKKLGFYHPVAKSTKEPEFFAFTRLLAQPRRRKKRWNPSTKGDRWQAVGIKVYIYYLLLYIIIVIIIIVIIIIIIIYI